MLTTLAVLGVVLAAVLIWGVLFNRLVELRNRIANAFDQIDVQLKRRHDLVPNLVEVARQAYNDQVLEFNNEASQFPGLIVARLLAFTPSAMLKATRSEEERSAPQVSF